MKHDTCPFYGQAETTTFEAIQGYLDDGTAKLKTDCSTALLSLVVDGLIASDFTKERIRESVREYRRRNRI